MAPRKATLAKLQTTKAATSVVRRRVADVPEQEAAPMSKVSPLERILSEKMENPRALVEMVIGRGVNAKPFGELDLSEKYQVLALLDMYREDQVLSFLSTLESPDDILRESPNLDRQKMDEELQAELLLNRPLEPVEGYFECKKCKSNRTMTFMMQTRAADEPMTTIFHCMDCGTQWRESG